MTRLLAIETSGRTGSVALFRDGQPLSDASLAWLSADRRTAQSLVPAIRDLFDLAGWAPRMVELVAVGVGPGSFTGLRIGVTTAKAFAYAVGAAVVGVNTMDVLAAPVPLAPRLWAVVDAQRDELFVACFAPDAAQAWATVEPTRVLARGDWLAALAPGDVVTGPVLDRLADQLPAGVVTATQELWTPSAECVAQVAWQAYQRGQRDDVFQLVPNYYRLSAAEEKAAANDVA